MNITPQLRLAIGLVALVSTTVLVADFLGLMPRPEEQIRDSRKLLGESLAVQLSAAAANDRGEFIVDTLKEIVNRNDQVLHAGLWREDGSPVASFGETKDLSGSFFDLSSYEKLIIPIFAGSVRWGEVRMQFTPSDDWVLRYLGFPAATLNFLLFLSAACMLTFYLFMRKALAELNPTKVVPERVNAAFDVLAEGVLIVDEKLRIVLANDSFASRIGEEPEKMIGKNPSVYEWDLSGDDVEKLPWQSALETGDQVTGMPLKLRVGENTVAFTVNAAPIEDGHGEYKGVLITFDDITPLEAKNAELAHMLAELSDTQKTIESKNKELEVLATRDPLTGCLNRRSFLKTFQQHFSEAEDGFITLSLLMVDIDHFKKVNDTHGHIVGDQVIKTVAKALQTTGRQNDAVGRYGGEEFVFSLPGADAEQSLMVAERVRQKMANLVAKGKMPVEVLTVSIGAASFEEGITDHMELLDRADRALYQAKQTGRDRVCQFDPAYTPQNPEKRDVQEENVSERDSQQGVHIMDDLKIQLEEMHELVQKQAQEITHRSMHDDITGLPNRFLLLDRLTQAMKLSDRNQNITAVVSISLSQYQHISDTLGHDAAEEMLKQAAERIEHVVRAVDSIGVVFNEEALTFSRIAHNELAMLLVDLSSFESVPKIIGRITQSLEQPFEIRNDDVLNQVYCGIALYPHDSKEADALIRNASLARNYAERRNQRSDNAYFSRDIDRLALKNAQIATELRKALKEDGLEIAYQPKVDAVTQQVTGVEALARWQHPELGHIGPLEFITVAENIGVIDQLTDWVLNKVCSDLSRARLTDLRVSVNVSPLELYDTRTADRILKTIYESGVSPTQLEVEITESSVLDNFETVRKILRKLQAEGVLVALDDFGTAYSSLNLLLEIPVDVIKVDRSFVTDLHDVPNNQSVVQAIVQMASSMGKRIVAEGVETEKERDCLMTLGCREIQGYLYSKPMPFDDLVGYINQHGLAEETRLFGDVGLKKTG